MYTVKGMPVEPDVERLLSFESSAPGFRNADKSSRIVILSMTGKSSSAPTLGRSF